LSYVMVEGKSTKRKTAALGTLASQTPGQGNTFHTPENSLNGARFEILSLDSIVEDQMFSIREDFT
jgi:hypothetical protein